MHTRLHSAKPRVQVQIVLYNNVDLIVRCLESVFQQSFQPERILLIDNGSVDGCAQLAEANFKNITLIYNQKNVGYAAGHNIGFRLAESDMDYVLTLNPDVKLTPHYLEILVDSLGLNQQIGGVSGKLLRMEPDGNHQPVFDSTGLVMQAFFHVRDRDSNLVDTGQRDNEELVWGVCGAAALYRVSMLKDVGQAGEAFDEAFFVYKEDVDLCWRALRRNWLFQYIPNAIAFHKRSWVKGAKMSALVESYSFANQIALLVRHVYRPSMMIVFTILVEFARYIAIMCLRPKVAIQIVRLLRNSWQYHWEARLDLKKRDLVKESLLNDIGYPGYL